LDTLPLSLAYLECAQCIGHEPDLGTELPAGYFGAVKVQSRLVRECAGRKQVEPMGRQSGIPDCGENIVIIMLMPRFIMHMETLLSFLNSGRSNDRCHDE
jgi:hypothetical protein